MNITAMIRQAKVIHISLFLGPSLFLIVIFALFGSQAAGEEVELALSRNMIYISFAVYMVSLGINKFLFPGNSEKPGENEFSSRLVQFQSKNMIRTAIAEAGVLNTLVGLFLYASAGGSLQDLSSAALFYLSYCIYVVIWGIYFPSRDKISSITGIPIEKFY